METSANQILTVVSYRSFPITLVNSICKGISMTKLKDITIFFNGTDMQSALYRYSRNESFPAPLKRAYLLAQNAEGLYYLVYDAKHEKWDLPGGHIEDHESVEQTLNRELQEEVGFLPSTYKISYVLAHNDARTEYEVIYGRTSFHNHRCIVW